MAISAALTPEAARSVLVLGFNDETEMHHPTNFSKIRQCVAHSLMIQQISVFRRDFVARSSQSRVDRTKLNLGRTCLFQRAIFSANRGSSTFSNTV